MALGKPACPAAALAKGEATAIPGAQKTSELSQQV